MRYVLGIPALLLGVALGLAWPDVDLKLVFLHHRSALTHSALLPLLLFWPARRWWRAAFGPFVIGICTALAAHFCFDLYPKSWLGFSLIKAPLFGRFSPTMSWLWLAVSAVVCLYLALLLADEVLEIVFAAGGMIISYHHCAVRNLHDGLALVSLLVATFVALLLPAHPVRTALELIAGRARYRPIIVSRGGEE